MSSRMPSARQSFVGSNQPAINVGEDAYVIDAIDFHRNGVTGEGFYLVEMHEEPTGEDIIAILFSHTDFKGERTDANGYCAVFSPNNPNTHYRGDRFELALRPVIVLEQG